MSISPEEGVTLYFSETGTQNKEHYLPLQMVASGERELGEGDGEGGEEGRESRRERGYGEEKGGGAELREGKGRGR